MSPRPVFPARARALLAEAREMLAGGARAEATALFAAAMALDPTVACLPWGLLPLLEAEGRGNFRKRMQARLQIWYRPPASPVHATVAQLTHKVRMRPYATALGLPLPALLARAETLADLDWTALPERVVLKPENAASSRGVIVAAADYDHIGHAPIMPDLRHYASTLYAEVFPEGTPVLAEEALFDISADADPTLVIPRDFKVFVVAGHAVYVRVHDRNAADGRRGLATYDRHGQRTPPGMTGWPEAPAAPVPPGWKALIAMAERISAALPWLLRLDFYLTPAGPVFGEFTTFPNAGLDNTPFSRRTLLQMWEIHPD